ncbi:hypothetical protein N409_02225 [Helicobacter pylori FD719]|nr:hypothetical protein N409_02225 [Helicobacter pylori FD719]
MRKVFVFNESLVIKSKKCKKGVFTINNKEFAKSKR